MSQDGSQSGDGAAAEAPFSEEQRTWLEEFLRRQPPPSSRPPVTTSVPSVATTVVSQNSVAGEWT